MKSSQSNLENKYHENIMNKHIPETVHDLFLTRFTAYRLLADPKWVDKAKEFLLSSMTILEEEYAFPNKIAYITNISHWDEPIIQCYCENNKLNAIVYKIKYKIGTEQKELFEISFFSRTQKGLKYTHKYDLTLTLAEKQEMLSEDLPIRQIGDSILAVQANKINFKKVDSTEITQQIDILKRNLYRSGGVGIAANQCSEIETPFQIYIAGVDYQNPQHIKKALFRYPSTLFPPMQVYLNPKIIHQSSNLVAFPEGCLSVKSFARALVLRPDALTIEYQDSIGNIYQKSFHDADARVTFHELDHILNGKVYIERVIAELSKDQINQLINLIQQPVIKPTIKITAPTLLFYRDNKNAFVFDLELASSLFAQFCRDTKEGFLKILNKAAQLHEQNNKK